MNAFHPASFFAPLISSLNQPILPLTFSNVYNVTEQNSSAPDVEGKILAKDSYGRQLGTLMDAVTVLIEREQLPGRAAISKDDKEKLKKLLALQKKIEATKLEAITDRLGRIKADLLTLKRKDRTSYDKLMSSLQE
ncbi:hypothetical protein [Undibacterium terreum]|nr:hypothetical protein [Undibacterium terreum]